MKKNSTYDAAERKRQLDRPASMQEDEINTSAPDSHIIHPDQLRSVRPFREVFRPLKTSISLRIDKDVLEYFKQQREGYQTRMNKALRAYMEQERQGVRR